MDGRRKDSTRFAEGEPASTYTGNLRTLLQTKPERGAGLILTAVMERIEGGGSGTTAKSELLTGGAQHACQMNKSGRGPETYSEERLARSGLEMGPLGLPVPQGWRARRRLDFNQGQQQPADTSSNEERTNTSATGPVQEDSPRCSRKPIVDNGVQPGVTGRTT